VKLRIGKTIPGDFAMDVVEIIDVETDKSIAHVNPRYAALFAHAPENLEAMKTLLNQYAQFSEATFENLLEAQEIFRKSAGGL
jgi:hypothetical protein